MQDHAKLAAVTDAPRAAGDANHHDDESMANIFRTSSSHHMACFMNCGSTTEAELLFRGGIETAEGLLKHLKVLEARDDEEFAFRAATLFLFAKAYKSYQAVRVLWTSGFAEDALVVARTIFELMLQATWVSLDPTPRARMLIEHERIAQYSYYERLKKFGDTDFVKYLESRPQELEALRSDFAKLKSNYAKKGKSIHENWWGSSIAQLSKWLGPAYQTQYARLYWLMSNFTHSAAKSIGSYINENSSGWLVNCRPAKATGLLELTPYLVTSWLLSMATIVNVCFRLGLDAELTKRHEDFQKIGTSKRKVPN